MKRACPGLPPNVLGQLTGAKLIRCPDHFPARLLYVSRHKVVWACGESGERRAEGWFSQTSSFSKSLWFTQVYDTESPAPAHCAAKVATSASCTLAGLTCAIKAEITRRADDQSLLRAL
ncbi:hypothetical protein RRG08_013863 [Elysia crispata]|uniref:Uncharacterized protein n=1 Tax=Elysia crispata TaxID=231223 RepID=A0AAE0YKV2_9GAST|nr:hypothetical protein RRG08_013863 [Elysia crispata]